MLKTITALLTAFKRNVAGIQSCSPDFILSAYTGFLEANWYGYSYFILTKEGCNITGGIIWI